MFVEMMLHCYGEREREIQQRGMYYIERERKRKLITTERYVLHREREREREIITTSERGIYTTKGERELESTTVNKMI